jgi:hypothetical protein
MMAFHAGDLVEVESIDSGFEGCWCEAVVQRTVNVTGGGGAVPRGGDAAANSNQSNSAAGAQILYEVKYTRFVSGAGKPIVEVVCETRTRTPPVDVNAPSFTTGEFVEGFWRDGWCVLLLAISRAILAVWIAA